MAFLLSDLLKDSVQPGSVDKLEVAGVNADSRALVPGEAFFALPGSHEHGKDFVPQAVQNGAVAIVSDHLFPVPNNLPLIKVEDVRAAYAKAIARMLAPQPKVMVAVTGTSGKTSVTSFVRQLWQASGIKAAGVGTLGIDVGGRFAGGELTTPDPMTLHKSLAVLKSNGTDHVVVEASSHGLDQRRLDGLRFKAVGYTNLGRDHLDYHGDLDTYRDAKLRLFKDLLADKGIAVVNTDDEEHMAFMFSALDRGAHLLTVGNEGAYIEVTSIEREGMGQRVKGKLVGEPLDFVLPLVGSFQVNNAVIALALATETGADREIAVEALNHLQGAKGRLERVGMHNGAAIFVDFSHKPMALEVALDTLRPFTKGKLICVFGCGGDRDKGKRPIMGKIASDKSDLVIVTDDNPRTEDPATIRAEIMGASPNAKEVGDRAMAIEVAMTVAGEGDVVLIAGKGHEDYQIIGETKHHFSDHEVVQSLMNKKGG